MNITPYYNARHSARVSSDLVLKSEVKDFICGCESLLSAVESGIELSIEELRLIELYAEVIQQSSAAGLFHLCCTGDAARCRSSS
jgi:hypothetical protein